MLWRLKVTISSEFPIVLPLSYNHLLQSYIYSNIEPQIASFLHEKGFFYGNKIFKLFTFSKIFGKYKVAKPLITFLPPIYFFFSTPINIVVESHFFYLLSKTKFKLGDNDVCVENVEFEEIKPQSPCSVITLSPITTYVTEGQHTRFFSPKDEEFYKLIKANFKKKYELFYQEPLEEGFDIKLLKFNPNKDKIITRFKDTVIEAWNGTFELYGNEKMLSLALSVGIGNKNSQGFGMIKEFKPLNQK